MIKDLKEEFISYEQKNYKMKIGKVLASSLSGVLAGVIITMIIILSFFTLTLK